MKKNGIFLLFFLLLLRHTFAQTRAEVLQEYDAALNRIKYASVCGFCFDGAARVPEQKRVGSEHSFFVQDQNVFLKVTDSRDKKTYYTRCFDIKNINGKLSINETVRIVPEIRAEGTWHFSKLGKKLNITVCTDTSCKNIPIPLYEITEKPLSVKDGILFSFKDGGKKTAENPAITFNTKAEPLVDTAVQAEKIRALFKLMEKDFAPSEIKEKRTEFEAVLKAAARQPILK